MRQPAPPERLQRIETLWNQGLTLRGISIALGVPQGTINRQVHEARQAGYRLPYRRSHKLHTGVAELLSAAPVAEPPVVVEKQRVEPSGRRARPRRSVFEAKVTR